MRTVSESLNGQTFTTFLRHLNELRASIIENKSHKLTRNSFLVFLDQVKNLTHSDKLNDLLLRRLAEINIKLVTPKALLNSYQEYSVDFKYEESLRIEEIQKFACDVVPEPKFLFNEYLSAELDNTED